MPFTGNRVGSTATLSAQGAIGHYWSSSPYGSARPNTARDLFISSSLVSATYDDRRSYGACVRLFLDEYIEPDNTRTVEQ